jgi:hypothetical protein
MKNNAAISPCRRPDNLPVSFIQKQVIGAELAGLYDPSKTRVNCPALSYLIKGRVNISVLDKALCEIVRRHEILRTNYRVVDEQIFQSINDAPHNILRVHDLSKLAQDDRKNEANRILTELTTCPFSFFNNKLMISATLIIAGDNEYILTVITNHIAADGLSMTILQRELFALYRAFLYNTPSPLPELPIQYTDFAIWEQEYYSGKYLEDKLNYWRNIPNTVNTFLPVDHAQASSSYTGDIVPVSILPELVKRLSSLGRNNNVTLFNVLFSAFISLIHSFSGYRYNFFCMPVANRARKETSPAIGCFMNFQFVYVDLDGNPTFVELIERVSKTLLDVYGNYVPFHFITEVIPQQGPMVDFQLLHTSMNLTAPPAGEKSSQDESQPASPPHGFASQNASGGLAVLPFRLPQSEFALFPIDVFLSGASGGLNGYFKYQTAVYDRSTILKLANNYVVLLMNLARNPNMRIREMGIEPHPAAGKAC